MNFIHESESFFRLLFSLGGLLLFIGLGLIFPFRKTKLLQNKRRWFDNLSLNFGNGLLVYILAPVSLAQLAIYAENNYMGLFNRYNWNDILTLICGLLILDLIIYWQHRLTHIIPILWRLHRVHHSDMEFDATTAGRFHPLEIFLSWGVKATTIITFGLAPETIILFEIILNFSALFNHSNFSFPEDWEKFLRLFVITPDMHRVHHSPRQKETDSNYGFCISLWDHLFKSYVAKTQDDPQTMDMGLKQFRDFSRLNYIGMILIPFLKK